MHPRIPAMALCVSILVLFIIFFVIKDQRKQERRNRRLFAPIERRRKDRRRFGIGPLVAWLLRIRPAAHHGAKKPPRPMGPHR